MGFQNKFYNASMKQARPAPPSGPSEYRVNMSSDTPHWYVQDYLSRVSSYYGITLADVGGEERSLAKPLANLLLPETQKNGPFSWLLAWLVVS